MVAEVAGSVLGGLLWGIGLGTAYGATVDFLRAGVDWAKWKFLFQTQGHYKVAEALQALLDAEKDEVTGLSTKGAVDTIKAFIDKTLDLAILTNSAIASQLFVQMIQQSVAYAISNSHAGSIGTIANVFSGSAPVHTMEIERVSEYADLLDRKLKAFLHASAGLNTIATAFKIQRGVNSRIAELFQTVQNAVERLQSEINDTQLEEYRHYVTMARNRFQDALEMYENIVTRAYTLIEQLAQEHLTRIAEQMDTLEGARAWYDGGFISEDELREIAIRINLEREASEENWNEMLEELTGLIEEQIKNWDVYINELLREYTYARALYVLKLANIISQVLREVYGVVHKFVEEAYKMVEDVCAYRNLKPPVKFEVATQLGEFEMSPEAELYRLRMRRWMDCPQYTVVMEYQMPSPKMWSYVEAEGVTPKPYTELPVRELEEVDYSVVVYHYQTPSAKGWVFVK